MKYYGFTFGGFHFYYECLDCHNYTEYHISLKNMLILCLIILLAMLGILALTLTIGNINPLFASIFFITSTTLYFVVGYKYRWAGFETIAIDNLPDRLLIRILPAKLRLIVIFTFATLLAVYTAIFISNLMKK